MKSFIKNYIVPIVLAGILYILINCFCFTMVKVDGISMQPNLQNGERVAVLRLSHIHPLSVIVFNAHGEDPSAKSKRNYYVKRVIGMPGDTVSHYNNNIYVNGKRLPQKFINNYQRGVGSSDIANRIQKNWNLNNLSKNWQKNRNSFKVPANEYFVMGDHRSVSNDSRYWGFVPKDKIMGVVKAMPWDTNSAERYNVNDRAE